VPGAAAHRTGNPDKSLVLLRMQTLDEHRMPPLASHLAEPGQRGRAGELDPFIVVVCATGPAP